MGLAAHAGQRCTPSLRLRGSVTQARVFRSSNYADGCVCEPRAEGAAAAAAAMKAFGKE